MKTPTSYLVSITLFAIGVFAAGCLIAWAALRLREIASLVAK